MFDRFERTLIRSFIELNPDVKWCPNPRGCDSAVKYSGSRTALRCGCGYVFCFLCLEPGHRPALCKEVKEWTASCDANVDVASVKYMLDNFKKCPKCNNFIEKNSGCKHMTCQRRAGGCGHQVCALVCVSVPHVLILLLGLLVLVLLAVQGQVDGLLAPVPGLL